MADLKTLQEMANKLNEQQAIVTRQTQMRSDYRKNQAWHDAVTQFLAYRKLLMGLMVQAKPPDPKLQQALTSTNDLEKSIGLLLDDYIGMGKMEPLSTNKLFSTEVIGTNLAAAKSLREQLLAFTTTLKASKLS